jgi:hypothetical protein
MKRIFLLASFALLPFSAPALAKDGKTCQAESAKLPAAERNAYMQKCIAQLGDPSNVKQKQQQDKQARCEQNAKNQNLQGNAKSSYLSSCMTKDEATAAKKSPAQAKATAPASRPAKRTANASGSKPSKSCARQANQKGLKGDERKQFLKECK